jgi:cytochrome c peroxidase
VADVRRSKGVALRHWAGVLALAFATATSAGEITLPVPDGVLPPLIPADNAVTSEKVALGQKLYFDPRLSKDDTVSCATCHDPLHAFAEPRPVSLGVGGASGVRNAPTVLNAAFLQEQFWDGRAATLEEQAKGPLVNPVEMAMPDHAAVAKKVQAIPEYAALFRSAFGDDQVTIDRIVQAVASFERTLISVEAPIDRFIAGDKTAISASAQRGWELFNGKARCNTCHGHVGAFPLFTDEQYHNLGIGDDAGRFAITKEQKDTGAFKTPQLRNVAKTAPYMHDGSEATLAAVIDFYNRGGNPNPHLDGGMRPLGLSDAEKAGLVALLETFTSDDLARFEKLAAQK